MAENAVAENKMGTEPIGRLLIKMAIPMMASMLVQALYNVVDSMYVSMINENALTAVSICFPMQNLIVAIGSGTCVGINALLSKSLGEKNSKLANMIASNGIFLGILSGIGMAILGFFITSPFIAAQSAGASAEIYEYGVTYLSIVCTFSFFMFMELTFERLLNSTGKTSYTMVSQLIGAITNIILDPIMIFGYFFFPEMGVAGAAVATVTGQGIAALAALALNLKKNKEISLSMRGFKPDGKIIKMIYKIGIPSIVMVSVSSVMTFGMNIILTGFTSTATAVFGVYFKMNSVIFFPVFGINNALVPIVAYNYGARKKSRIKKAVKLSVIAGMSIMAIGTLLFWIIPDQLLLIFNASEDMLDIGRVAFNIISISFIPAGYSIILGSVLQAVGDALFSMINSLARQLVVLLPVAYILSRMIGLEAIWWSYPIAEVVSLLLMTIFFIRVYRKKIAPLPD
jgi:putative MATE family efflux protein